jgi:hypothetical protein
MFDEESTRRTRSSWRRKKKVVLFLGSRLEVRVASVRERFGVECMSLEASLFKPTRSCRTRPDYS